jgi:hypothetical protein
VGDGGTFHGIDENNTISSYKSLVRIHMAPYFDAVAKGVSTVMISFSSWNGVKMHANHKLISRVLKKQLQFKVSFGCGKTADPILVQTPGYWHALKDCERLPALFLFS